MRPSSYSPFAIASLLSKRYYGIPVAICLFHTNSYLLGKHPSILSSRCKYYINGIRHWPSYKTKAWCCESEKFAWSKNLTFNVLADWRNRNGWSSLGNYNSVKSIMDCVRFSFSWNWRILMMIKAEYWSRDFLWLLHSTQRADSCNNIFYKYPLSDSSMRLPAGGVFKAGTAW